MEFRIKKQVDNIGTWYWTIPKNIFLRIWHFISDALDDNNSQEAYDCWMSLDEAKQHIKRWNNGYYKKRYYSKYI